MQNLADITGDNAVHPIILASPARWVEFTLIGSGTGRIGGASTSSTVGKPLVASATGTTWTTPAFMQDMGRYQITEFYAYVPTGATLRWRTRKGRCSDPSERLGKQKTDSSARPNYFRSAV